MRHSETNENEKCATHVQFSRKTFEAQNRGLGVSKRGNASQSSLMSAAPMQPSWCFMAWQTDYCGFCGAHSFKDVSKYQQQQQLQQQ